MAARRRIKKSDGAGEGNRTLTTSLEGWGSTVELHPHVTSRETFARDEHDRVVGGAGFEPAKAMPPDLQSGPVDRLGIRPSGRRRTRVPDPDVSPALAPRAAQGDTEPGRIVPSAAKPVSAMELAEGVEPTTA